MQQKKKNTYQIKNPTEMLLDFNSWCMCENTPVAMRVINGKTQICDGWVAATSIPTPIAQDAVANCKQKYEKFSATIIQYMGINDQSVAWLSKTCLITVTPTIEETAKLMNRPTCKDFLKNLKLRAITR